MKNKLTLFTTLAFLLCNNTIKSVAPITQEISSKATTNSATTKTAPHYTSNKKKRELEIFRTIYKANIWQDETSRSGPGSSLKQTGRIRDELPKILQSYDITFLIDAPCGDFNWIKELNLPGVKYVGVDIVPEVIQSNLEKYASENRIFLQHDITDDNFPYLFNTLPANSAILCRDCLTHLSFEDIMAALRNFKKTGARYLMISTYPERKNNLDIQGANLMQLLRYRPLNFEIAPFNFPKPLYIFNEANTEGNIEDKSLALWEIASLPL